MAGRTTPIRPSGYFGCEMDGACKRVDFESKMPVGPIMSKLRILLGDDHTVVRQGFRKILEQHTDWEVVAEAADGRTAVKRALELVPDVAVLDIGMPLMNGIEATRQILRRAPTVHVLILSMHSNE